MSALEWRRGGLSGEEFACCPAWNYQGKNVAWLIEPTQTERSNELG